MKKKPYLWKIFPLIVLTCFWACSNRGKNENSRIEIRPHRFQSVRFDPSYYYDRGQRAGELCRELSVRWRQAGINAVYVKAYDPLYGAVYRTKYDLNLETDFGRLDLMNQFIKACHNEGILVYAWVPAFLHKQAWEAHPEWRVKKKDGADYRTSADQYPLCTRHPGYRRWWSGFVDELLEKCPGVDGIDIGEPVVGWKEGEACFCDACLKAHLEEKTSRPQGDSEAFNRVRSGPLTSLLAETVRKIHSKGKNASITSVMTARRDGTLHSPAEQRGITGFDLDAVLDSPDQPDVFNAEIIWQQFASDYRDTLNFTPSWTSTAAAEAVRQVAGRADLVVHVELTRLGSVAVSNDRFFKTMDKALVTGVWGIDFYDAFQADTLNAWDGIRATLGRIPDKTVSVYYDPDGENDARQLEVLLRHFHTRTTLISLDETVFAPDQPAADFIFYMGETVRDELPGAFLRFIGNTDATVCWLSHNLRHLGGARAGQTGFSAGELLNDAPIRILYKNETFPKSDSLIYRVRITDSTACRVLAFAATPEGRLPYAVRSGRFWYFADLPTAFIVEGGHHIVFADLLHDILQEDHEEKHLALIRIEDMSPMSDPASLRAIAKYLGGKHLPFALGFTPFFLDPASNTSVSLSERPDFAKALRYAVSRGGTVVLHGCTHQYRGQTTDDYEFWDELNDQPVFQDSPEYVRSRIERAVDECVRSGVYPLAWETPHYAASLLDYGVIDRYFSTAYERRQTLNLRGADQLLPFFIPPKDGKPQLVPENLGYIPMDNPDPAPMLENARRNLAVRDGYASFFFHPFVPLSALKDLVKGMGRMGYAFADIRSLDNRVQTSSHVMASGRYAWESELTDQYLVETDMNSAGKSKRRTVSPGKINGSVSRNGACPGGWTYAASVTDQPREAPGANLWTSVSRSPGLFNRLRSVPLLSAQNRPLVPAVIVDPEAEPLEARNQSSYLNAFKSVGVDCRTLPLAGFFGMPEGINLIVIPGNAAGQLSEQQKLFVIDAVARGMNLILEDDSDLARRIGIETYGESRPAMGVRDEYYPQVTIRWKQRGWYRRFRVDLDFVTYYSEETTGDPVVIGGEYGEGKYLFFCTQFDPLTAEGYGRFPYFCDLLQRQFGLWPLVRSESAEIYFEPGDREDVSIEDLVKMWKSHGFRTVYAAGWHVYSDWTYDYGRLIELAHENAMLVYLWLDLPHVNQKFWDEHPEWREKTAAGGEAVVDGRQLMALTIESCKQTAMDEIADLINRFDWDGVNLAGLNFESPSGPERPGVITPMNDSVREAFASQYGFDPIELFNSGSPHFWKRNDGDWQKFQAYRKQGIADLHHDFLEFLYRVKAAGNREMEIMVTAVDPLHAQKKAEAAASDVKRLLALEKEFPFTLQIEDNQELRARGPDRYRELSDAYPAMRRNGGLVFDVNVAPFRGSSDGLSPTRLPTGMELNRLIFTALQDSNRVALHTESSMYEVDFPWIAYTLGCHAEETIAPTRWDINSKDKVVLYLDSRQHRNIRVNGKLWPAYWRGKMILPPGRSIVEPIRPVEEFRNTFTESARLVDINGGLRSCQMVRQGFELTYEGSVLNYVTVNEKPRKVILDGRTYAAGIRRGIPGFTIQLPAGTHRVRILTGSIGSLTIKRFSIVASVLIVVVSSIAGTVLLFLYLGRARRKRIKSPDQP